MYRSYIAQVLNCKCKFTCHSKKSEHDCLSDVDVRLLVC